MTNLGKDKIDSQPIDSEGLLWTPSRQRLERSLMHKFLEQMLQEGKFKNPTWNDLYQWSIRDTNDFWLSLSSFVNIKWMRQPSTAFLPGRHISAGVWFPDAQLNFAQNLLPTPDQKIVMISIAEGGAREEWSGIRLWNDVAKCARALKNAGIGPGDRVAGVLINGPEAVVAMLAAASLGAVWASCSPDFGTNGIRDRLIQIRPKVVFATTAYRYANKLFSNLNQTKEAVLGLQPLPKLISVDHFSRGNDEFFEFCNAPLQDESKPLEIEFEPRRFADPQYIMFSSGTTGLPKCIIHGIGGTLLQHKKELMLHSDLNPQDRLLFFTTCGWMMWNWMVSALSVGACIITFDGSPGYPSSELLWDICRTESVSHFGISPKFLSMCIQSSPKLSLQTKQFPKLRTILSTGSPLLPAHYDWVYRQFPDIHLASISGGTDIIGCFMLGNPLLPVYSGEIQSPGLGMAIESWNESAKPTRGEKGELVCLKPFVSMPTGFWNDPDGERYKKAYFTHYNNQDVWRHGDFIEITQHGGIIVYGRSDATLNPGGVRIGTSEIYRAVENLPSISDSLAVGQDFSGDVRVILFVKLASGLSWSADIETEIKAHIRSQLTARHVPSRVIPVKDIPYTRSGKKVELAVTKILRGEDVSNREAISNPESLSEYENLRQTVLRS